MNYNWKNNQPPRGYRKGVKKGFQQPNQNKLSAGFFGIALVRILTYSFTVLRNFKCLPYIRALGVGNAFLWTFRHLWFYTSWWVWLPLSVMPMEWRIWFPRHVSFAVITTSAHRHLGIREGLSLVETVPTRGKPWVWMVGRQYDWRVQLPIQAV